MKRSPLKRGNRLPSVSSATAKRNRAYSKARVVYLRSHPDCAGRGVTPVTCGGRATEVHHARGRVGADMLDTSHWWALCRACHRWATDHPAAARDVGLSEHRNTVRPDQ